LTGAGRRQSISETAKLSIYEKQKFDHEGVSALTRHCEKRSDEAIQSDLAAGTAPLFGALRARWIASLRSQ
jgi:hypothetical protein